MITAIPNPLVQHLLDVAFDLANNAGRLIQRIADTRESNQPGDDTFQRLMRKAQVSFDQLVEDADQYILTVEESGDAPLDYRSLEGLTKRLRTMERELKRLMNDPETPSDVTALLEQCGFRRAIAKARSRMALAAHVSKQRQVIAKTYDSTVSPAAYAAAATLMTVKLSEKARKAGD
ncbi:hypothetical protein QC823_16010 [Halomonas vilamensis]|uniref:Uncharacterized protein n=1 Tax=Vreelandella vilamensis TaxID=531309 RepID=A0ABU1H839_9GAMM|nr:hypothetical protein [Halomonas vilamensis]MDR5900469.1 hypothetical protein [Halomonas vilamensis]